MKAANKANDEWKAGHAAPNLGRIWLQVKVSEFGRRMHRAAVSGDFQRALANVIDGKQMGKDVDLLIAPAHCWRLIQISTSASSEALNTFYALFWAMQPC